jgi:ribosomal protein S18 acetylase RimI-like enzyme
MSSSAADCTVISPTSAEERPRVLAMVFDGLLEPKLLERAEEVLGADGTSWEGLFSAHRGDRLVGAVLVQPQPGRLATVWFPRVAPGEPASTAAGLLAASSRFLDRLSIQLAQCLPRTVAAEEDALLKGAGFHWLANLFYLACTADRFPQSLPEGAIAFEPYAPTKHARLAGLVEATYQATQDCPSLNGVRSIKDTLQGYRASGRFAPDHWLLATHQGRDVGCLLLADYPDQGNFELVYMGIIPESRGHGWGIELARYAQWRAGRAGRQRLVLAVDAANQPALRMYAAAGFSLWDQRSVYLKILRDKNTV